jgi:hypothetical protein
MRLAVSHDYGIDHDAKLLEVINQIALLSLVRQPTNKQFDLMVWTLEIEIVDVGLRAGDEDIPLILSHDRVHALWQCASRLPKLIEVHVKG